MTRKSVQYACQECGASHAKWSGQCSECNAWNSLAEQNLTQATPKGMSAKKGRVIEFVGLSGESSKAPRLVSGINEFDRVTGGGLVAGSALLVGGDPGVGKSTLMMQVAAALSKKVACAYISGEEAVDQLRMRASRLGVAETSVKLAAATSVRDITTTMEAPNGPRVVIIDSIQTMYVDNVDSAPGSVTQVRTSSQELIRLAKSQGFCVILVGHVTKEGAIAGPRILEHMVDTVLYFEGERSHQFRILRSVKNRYGATDEIGVFEMGGAGLGEVSNPSALFLGDQDNKTSGAAVFAGVEGTRPLLVEIQSLIAHSQLATPRRAVVGWDSSRLAMLMAVLETRCGLAMGGADVYLNVAGGLRIIEPAADLAVAAALVSSLSGKPIPAGTTFFGEVGLSGEIRPVTHSDVRLKEAEKLGFSTVVMPPRRKRAKKDIQNTSLNVVEIDHLADLVARFGSSEMGVPKAPQSQNNSQEQEN
jgi:DNA repair protein RadA/Sms